MLKARKEKLMQPPEGGEVSKGGGGGFLAKLRASVIFVSEKSEGNQINMVGDCSSIIFRCLGAGVDQQDSRV